MLLTKYVTLKWNSKIYKHYVDLGYTYTKMNDEFEVYIDDLTPYSRAKDETSMIIVQEEKWYKKRLLLETRVYNTKSTRSTCE